VLYNLSFLRSSKCCYKTKIFVDKFTDLMYCWWEYKFLIYVDTRLSTVATFLYPHTYIMRADTGCLCFEFPWQSE
jgi:hypothetical protein